MKKKILFFTRTMEMGGTERVILNLCEGFKDNYDIVVVSSGGVLVKNLEKMSIKHISIGDIENKNLFNMISIFHKLRKIMRTYNFDIVHTHHRMAAFYISLCVTKKIKIIHTMHNSFYDKYHLTRFSLRKSKVIACGNSVERNLIEVYRINKDNIIEISNGLSNRFIKEDIDIILKYKKMNYKIFGFVGRLSQQKGIDVLLSAFNDVEKCILLIYGKGELEEFSKKYVNDNKCSNIYFMGMTDNPLNVISQLDCLILPSRWEGLPLNIIEAFSVQTLVISSNIDNNLELMKNSNGLVFEMDNSDDLRNKIKIVLESNCDKYIANAYKEYKKNYCLEKFLDKYEEVYSEKNI